MITTEKDAYDAIVAHHATLTEDVNNLAELIASKVEYGESEEPLKSDLIKYFDSEVVPHALAEEHSIYEAAEAKVGLADLIAEMTQEHKILIGELTELKRDSDATKVHANRLASLFSQHVAKENELILPILLDSNEVDLTVVLSEMHQLFEAAKQSAASSNSQPEDLDARLLSLLLDSTKEIAKMGNSDLASRITASAWAALEGDRPDLASKATTALHRLIDLRHSEPVQLSRTHRAEIAKELDVRPLPPAQRHSQIFAAYRELEQGSGFLLINDHDPKPLKYQFEAEYAGQFTWDYLEAGPKVWRVRVGRPS